MLARFKAAVRRIGTANNIKSQDKKLEAKEPKANSVSTQSKQTKVDSGNVVKQLLERNKEPQPQDNKHAKLPKHLDNMVSKFLIGQENKGYSQANAALFTVLAPERDKFFSPDLSQAVIDGDEKEVKKILDANLELLLAEPKGIVIQSQLTHQKFVAEKPLVMALKRGQIGMVKLLLSYFTKLKEKAVLLAKAKQEHNDSSADAKADKPDVKILTVDEIHAELVSQWVMPELDKEVRNFLEEQLQNKYMDDIFQPLIDIFKEEKCENGYKGQLSEKTEAELEKFRNRVLNDKAIKLLLLDEAFKEEGYFDITHLLIAASKVLSVNNEKNFKDLNWDQYDAYCLRVIGFILPLVHPELGQICCEGLYDVVEQKKELSEQAKNYKLKTGEDFYRKSIKVSLREGKDIYIVLTSARAGQGFGFVCNIDGHGVRGAGGTAWVPTRDFMRGGLVGLSLKKHVEQMHQSLTNLGREFGLLSSNPLSPRPH